VSIFLTESGTRHSLLHKQKHFRDKTQTKLTSNSSKLTGISREAPIDVDGRLLQEAVDTDVPRLLRDEVEDQDNINLDDIPALDETPANLSPAKRRPKRRRPWSADAEGQGEESDQDSGADNDVDIHIVEDSSDDELFVGDRESDSGESEVGPPPSKRRKEKERDDKKKLAMDISYEGFAIYGRVLCLVVKRRDGGNTSGTSVVRSGTKSQTGQPGGQAMMENWITSTQLPEAGVADDDAL
jgi:hypothetical protein